MGSSVILFLALLLIVFQYPIDSLSSDEIHSLWVTFRLQAFFVIQLWSDLSLHLSRRMWGLDLFVYHNNRINFEYIFGEYAPNLLHFQQQLLFASSSLILFASFPVYTFLLSLLLFLWYYASFVAVPSIPISHEQKLLPKTAMGFITPTLFALFLLFILPLPGVPPSLPSYLVLPSAFICPCSLPEHHSCSILSGSFPRLFHRRSNDQSQPNPH